MTPRHRLAAPVLLAAALALAACSHETPPPEPPRPVVTVKVEAGPGLDASVYSGEVRARHESELAFRVGGKVIARTVDVGAAVAKGTVLARLDPSDLHLNAEAAKATLAAARTDYDFAKAELERYKSLLAKKFISETVYDAKVAAFNSAKARLEQAESQLAVARNQSAYATLTAHEDGVITAISVEAGQVVTAGQPVMRLARPEEKEVLVNIPETRLADLREPGRRIQVQIVAQPDKVYEGRVREVAPKADPASRTFATRITIVSPGPAVALGMTANVLLATPEGSRIALPLTALYHSDGKPAVWVVDEQAQAVKLRPVDIAQYREDAVVLRGGLEPGERVVVAGVNKLVEGQQVRVTDAAKGPRS